MHRAIAAGQERVQGISSLSLCTGMLKKCDQAGLEQCGKQWLLTDKEQKEEGRAGGTTRVGSSAIHLWLEGIWGAYSIDIKNKVPATLQGVVYQDGDFNEKLHLMRTKTLYPETGVMLCCTFG